MPTELKLRITKQATNDLTANLFLYTGHKTSKLFSHDNTK